MRKIFMNSMGEKISHDDLLKKLTEHEGGLSTMGESIKAIELKLDPIVKGINSIAFAFKGLLVLGSGSAAVAGILVLTDRF